MPSQGGRGRSLNQIEVTPSARIRSVGAVMPAPVIGASWASRAVFQFPGWVGGQDVGSPGAVGAGDFEFGVGAGVPGRVRQLQLQLQQVVGDRLQAERAGGGAGGVGEEP